MTLLETVWWYLENTLEYSIQMIPCMLVGLFGYLLVRPVRNKRLAGAGLKSGLARECALLVFVMFCAGLSSLTVFPANFWTIGHWTEVLHGQRPLFPPVDWRIQLRTLQLTPFQEIRRAIRGPWVMFLMLANIGIFTPIGFLPALLWRNWRWWKSMLLGLLTSCTIEFVQFFIGRSPDIDDVILNTTGALVGFWLFWLLRSIIPKFTIKFQCQSEGENGNGSLC